jgi:cysteine-rich repeat protein
MNRVWLWRNNSWYLVWEGAIDKGIGNNCKIDYDFSPNLLNFKTDKIKIETCGWTWSAIDAVKFCGSNESFPEINIINPLQDSIIDASEKNVVVKISTNVASECRFSYDKKFEFFDGIKLSTTDGITYSYNLTKPLSMDSIEIYYKCKRANGKVNPYSVMHRFDFREINNSFIEICNWYNCSEGAASISIDDNIDRTVCREKLEKAGLKGTYFLAYTNTYNQSDWDIWRGVYSNGHEIGGHSQSHNCSEDLDKNFFTNEIQSNINDIINNIGMSRNELVTYDWPCGVAPPQYQEWLSDYYLFARGYHINSIESKNPENFMNLKSINTMGVGLNPPDYYLLTDVTENYQDWVNYVYHDSCTHPEIIDYLLTKDLWIETIGTVSKYIKERNTIQIQNIRNTSTGVIFDLVNSLNTNIFNKELTLKIYLGNGSINKIKVNGKNTKFTKFMTGDQSYVKFNVIPLSTTEIEISGLRISMPYCGDGKINQNSEECDDGNIVNGDGCSNCRKEISNNIYIILYVGNIDGNASTAWYPFYDRLTKYFEDNKIPVAFSFFPDYIRSDNDFAGIFRRMYLADNIELLQKGFTMNETEERMDELSIDEQKHIIKAGQDYYIEKMKEILNSKEVNIPVTYVAPFGKFTTDTRRAIEELGFRTNFGLYYLDELGPVSSTATLDSIQYGVSFTVSGTAGRNETFKQPDDIIQELLRYNRIDVPMLTIYGKRVIPLYVHQPDFEDFVVDGQINETKWRIYNETITILAKDPNIEFVTPNQVWNMRHPVCIPTGIPETFCNRVDDDCDGTVDEDCGGGITTTTTIPTPTATQGSGGGGGGIITRTTTTTTTLPGGGGKEETTTTVPQTTTTMPATMTTTTTISAPNVITSLLIGSMSNPFIALIVIILVLIILYLLWRNIHKNDELRA